MVSVKSTFEREGVRFAEVSILKSKSLKQVLSEKERREVRILLLNGRPALALDDDEVRFNLLKRETDLSAFVSTISGLISYLRFEKDEGIEALKKRRIGIGSLHRASTKKLDEANDQIKKRQKLLEEQSQVKRLRLIKKMLSEEISCC